MNRGVNRGIGQGNFWPNTASGPVLPAYTTTNVQLSSNVPRYDPTKEGSVAWDGIYNMGTVQGLATGVLNVPGSISAESGFLGLCFIATQLGGAARLDLRGTGTGSTASAYVASASGDTLAGWNVGGARTSSQLADTATIECAATENWNSTSAGSKWVFNTTPNTTVTKTLALTLDQDQSGTFTNKLTWASVALGTKSSNYNMTDVANATTVTLSGQSLTLQGLNFAPAVTVTGNNLNTVNGFVVAPTVTVALTQTAFGNLWNGFTDSGTVQAATGGGASLLRGVTVSFASNPTITIQDAHDFTIDAVTGFNAGPHFSPFGATPSGALTVTALTAFQAAGFTVPANATITTAKGLNVAAPTITGTITTWVGVDIASVTGAGTNIGLRNASQTQLGSSQQMTVDASGNVTTSGTLQAAATTLTTTLTTASASLGTKTAAYTMINVANATTGTIATNGITITGYNFAPSITESVLLAEVDGIVLAPTITTTATPVTAGWIGFSDVATFQSTTSSAGVLAATPISFKAGPTLKTQDAQNQTLTSYTSFMSKPVISSGGATFTITSLLQFDAGVITIPTNCTVTTLTQFRAVAPTITGTLTTWIGLDIPSVTGAGTNIGIRSGSSILVNQAVGIGYAAGAGGTASQSTNKSTAFPTISKSCGTLTWNNAALAANTSVTSGSSTNTVIAATDVVIFQHISGGTLGAYTMTCTPGSGSWTLTLHNVTQGSLSEAPVFAFAIIKAATT